MSGDKPVYNPEGLSEEELKADEEAAAKKREELMAKLDEKARVKKEAPPEPKLKKVKQKFRSGLGVHHEGRSSQDTSDKRDKSDVENDREISAEGLNRKISDLLKKYKLDTGFKFRVLGSNKTKGSYEFKLLENYRTILEFEDKPENIVIRLEEYLRNKSV